MYQAGLRLLICNAPFLNTAWPSPQRAGTRDEWPRNFNRTNGGSNMKIGNEILNWKKLEKIQLVACEHIPFLLPQSPSVWKSVLFSHIDFLPVLLLSLLLAPTSCYLQISSTNVCCPLKINLPSFWLSAVCILFHEWHGLFCRASF